MKQLLMVMVASVLVWGCNDILTNQYPYGEEFTLDYRKSALVGGESLVQFIGIKEDSRCPTDVECVWEGNAAAEFSMKVSGFPAVRFVLNTHSGFEQEKIINGVRIRLVEVLPAPVSTQPIRPDQYTVRVVVDR
ncbi:MAG: hypothetical protein AB7H80_17540 [Candidatus Kapaibacterium sp.]